MLEIQDLVCRIGHRTIIGGITHTFEPGLFNVIVGPNGSGKSTFLKAFSGEWSPSSGDIRYDGITISQLDKTSLARRRAVMTQLPELSFPLSVDEIVMMGRYPHFSFRPSPKDELICRQVMDLLSIGALTGRDYLTLSGGERQCVQFARALVQIWDLSSPDAAATAAGAPSTRYLFLDEPVSSLDIHYQHQFLQTARALVKKNIVLIAILHDLNLALQYADRLLLMKEGRIAAEGAAAAILTPALIRDIFQIEARLLDDPQSATPVIVFTSTHS